MRRTIFLLAIVTLLSACSTVTVDDYSDRTPPFDVEVFFDGELTAHGVVLDRGDRVIRSFNADIIAYWEDGVGTLEEDFVFDDGEEQRRVWTLQPSGDNTYAGTAGDVVGEGLLRQAGNSVFLDYTLRIPFRGSTVDVRVDDRMYLVSPDVLINESVMHKFGFRVGRIILTIVRQPDAA